ncbi:NAD(P)/FAD-dependent oxidoreductase [Salinibacterium sp. TMP30]|uniref:FAD/NAD(P)-dependent oxidoreductase n=1 Tax=Salinibacterium sp. TMP30 TaxID=3138237 RepID=UPI003138F327
MYDLAIIGAGPAGMAAAVTAADQGLSVVVFDEQQRVGGQIFRQPPTQFTGAKTVFGAGYGWGRELIGRSESNMKIAWEFGTTVFGLLRDRVDGTVSTRVAVTGPNGSKAVAARRIIIATGAYDMPVAIPGWTLPGVIMAGAVQSLLKSQKLLSAPRLVLAGSHPLLIVVADQLRKAGADIAEVAFARGLPTMRESIGSISAVPGHVGLFAETGVAIARLLSAGVKISTKTIVTAALGDRHVGAVELTKVDAQWHEVGRTRRIETSALVLGYGFQPSTELARQAGCEMVWDSPKGGWVVAHDELMRTSAPQVYVAGEPTGVAGAEQSRAEGRLAALAVAKDLAAEGVAGPYPLADGDLRGARRELRYAQKFSVVVQRLFEPQREALSALATPETQVCRCELVTKGAICETLDRNPEMSTASAVKLECRSGMGACQGRYCESSVAALVATKRQRSVSDVGYFSAHLPVKPVPVEALTMLDGD